MQKKEGNQSSKRVETSWLVNGGTVTAQL